MNIIKECFDNLPMALCFFNRRGIACLVNRRMLWVSTQLLGSSVQTLSELERALKSPPDTVAQLETQPPTYRFSDGSILRFTREVIRDEEGHRYTQVTASDVTELVRQQYTLAAENRRLEDANERLQQLMAQMPEIVREEEILAMKMRVHDDIGHSILSARRALLQETDLSTIQENAAVWEKAISLLHRANGMTQPDDALEYAISRGKALGVQDRNASGLCCKSSAFGPGNQRMCHQLRSPCGRNGTVCPAAQCRKHAGCYHHQQWCGTRGNHSGGRRTIRSSAAGFCRRRTHDRL